MEDALGLLRVKVIKGTDLAVRDISSSDPYVVVKLGDQSVKTKVIKRNLNPVWDEELTVSVPNPIPLLKLQVRDKDMLSKDDKMGEASIDLKPLFMAAHTNGSEAKHNHVSDHIQRGVCELQKNDPILDHDVVKDSHFKVVNGQTFQDFHVKLENVESGELELQLKWIDLTDGYTNDNLHYN